MNSIRDQGDHKPIRISFQSISASEDQSSEEILDEPEHQSPIEKNSTGWKSVSLAERKSPGLKYVFENNAIA